MNRPITTARCNVPNVIDRTAAAFYNARKIQYYLNTTKIEQKSQQQREMSCLNT